MSRAAGEGTTTDTTAFGERVREMREERGYKLRALAALCPPYTRGGKTTKRTPGWLSRIEKAENEPSLSDLMALAEALQVDVRWLLTGEESGDSEFIARLRTMEPLMDDRGRREVLALADRQVEENTASFDANVRRLVAAGFGLEEARRGARAMQSTDPGSSGDQRAAVG